MVISKDKNIVLSFDNEVVLSNQGKPSGKKNIIIDYVNPNASVENISNDDVMYISNPGEYEFFGVLIKVSKNLNSFIASDNIKIYLTNDISEVEGDKNAAISDVFIFDNYSGKSFAAEDVVSLGKIAQPKVIIVNGEHLKGDLNNIEKINKIKLKNSDLDSIIDTKLYLL